jgi:hypothetical protein
MQFRDFHVAPLVLACLLLLSACTAGRAGGRHLNHW